MKKWDWPVIIITIVQGICFIVAMILDALPNTHFETIELVMVLSMITSTYIVGLKEIREGMKAIWELSRDKKKKKSEEDEDER